MSNPDGKFQVNITPNALKNIKEIIDFYVDTMNYPPAAKEFRDAVYEKLQVISKNPHMYGNPDNLPGFAEMGYRKAPVYKHHVILYLLEPEAVHVVYVVDTRQNLWLATPIKLLKQTEKEE